MSDLTGIEREFYKELGAKLRTKRKQRKMTAGALAAEVGVHRNTVSRWEQGEFPIPVWMLIRVSDILCCQHLFLLPAREFTWGDELRRLSRERDPLRGIQLERDPAIDAQRELRKPLQSANRGDVWADSQQNRFRA